MRIGFFARKPIARGEELTFDYQFQTVGKKQQKCYCGTEKCRGYLGATNSNASHTNNSLNNIWSDDSETEVEEEDDDAVDNNDDKNQDNSSNSKKNKKRKFNSSDDLDVNKIQNILFLINLT